MRKTEESLNTASGLRIAMILLGIAVTPVLLSSSSLGNQLSSSNLISVVLLGGLILTILSAITISVGEKARLPTYGIVKYAFGEKGDCHQYSDGNQSVWLDCGDGQYVWSFRT